MVSFDEYIEKIKLKEGVVRISVLGDGGVGKTTILRKLIQQTQELKETPFLETSERTYFLNIATWELGAKRKRRFLPKKITVQNFDIAGQSLEGCNPGDLIPNVIFSKIDVFVFVLSVDNFESLEGLNHWLKMVESNTTSSSGSLIQPPEKILVANKIDLEKNVDLESVKKDLVGENKPFKYFIETSATAKDDKGIEILIDTLAQIFSERLSEDETKNK